MSERHAFAVIAVFWFALWGVIGYLDPTVNVISGMGIGVALAVGIAAMCLVINWAWKL